jgi:hypothetical protein
LFESQGLWREAVQVYSSMGEVKKKAKKFKVAILFYKRGRKLLKQSLRKVENERYNTPAHLSHELIY